MVAAAQVTPDDELAAKVGVVTAGDSDEELGGEALVAPYLPSTGLGAHKATSAVVAPSVPAAPPASPPRSSRLGLSGSIKTVVTSPALGGGRASAVSVHSEVGYASSEDEAGVGGGGVGAGDGGGIQSFSSHRHVELACKPGGALTFSRRDVREAGGATKT